MNILTDQWEAVGSVVRTVFDEREGGHLFVCDCYSRRDGQVCFNTINAGDIAALIARTHNDALRV